MASAGLSPPDEETNADEMAAFSAGILDSLKEKNRLLADYRAPVDSRIEAFLNEYCREHVGNQPLRLPGRSLTFDRHGMARELSLPVNGHSFQNSLVNSYRCFNGVLNNPRADRRTTAGTFHVVEGGLPIPRDKRAVPVGTFRQVVSCGDATAGGPDDPALPVAIPQPRPLLGIAVVASARLSRGARLLRRQVDGDSFLCPRFAGQQS